VKGKIKFYKEGKSWGFITGEDQRDYFFHSKDLMNRYRPKKDDIIQFDLATTDRGKKAINIINGFKKEV